MKVNEKGPFISDPIWTTSIVSPSKSHMLLSASRLDADGSLMPAQV